MQRQGVSHVVEYDSDMDFVHENLKHALANSNQQLLQRELHACHEHYTLYDAVELIFRCTVNPPSLRILQAVVSPGGIWDQQTHGFWTRFRLPEDIKILLGLHFNMLLHDAIAISTQAPDPAISIIEFLLQEDVQLVGIRNDRGELPWQLALKVTAPVAVVMLLLPVPEHLTWANSDRELSPEAFADAICQRLTQLGQTQLLPHYRTLSNALRARRNEVKAFKTRTERKALEEAQLAHIMFPLQQLPELSAATDAATNKKVKEHVVTLMQSDTLQIIEGNGKFLRLCSQYLCDALWQAAVNHRLKHMGPVVDLYRAIQWHKSDKVANLDKPQVQLLQQAIKSHDVSLVKLLLDLDATLLSKCSTPPLCLLLEEGTPVPLDIVDALLDACHDHRQNGIDELHKQMSALGYAMQSGQTEIVDKLIPWSRVDHRFLAKAANTPATAGARFTPLLYAVEVKQHSWAVALIRQAKQQFKLDAEKQFDITYGPHDVTAKRRLEQQIARTAQRKMQGWLDTACGAGNPPAALVRALELEQWETAMLLVTEQASPFKTCYRGADESTALHKAVELGRLDVVRAIAKQMTKGVHNVKELQTVCPNKTPLLLSVAKKQFEIAEVLTKAGADPWFVCSPVEGGQMTAVQALLDVIVPGDKIAEMAGLKLMQQLLSSSRPTEAQLAATMCQAIHKSQLAIATLLMRRGADIAQIYNSKEGVSSPLLLLINAAEDASKASSATEMLREVLVIWNIDQTARAVHCSMHEENQQRVVRWMLEHKQSTILPFAKDKKEQRRLVQQVIDARSITLLSSLVNELKMSCNGCYLHAIVNDIPLQLLDTLLRASDSVNQRHPESKNYIIHKAVEANRVDVVERLAQSRAQLKARDGNGNTALHLAMRCKEQNTQEQIIAALLKKDPSLLKEVNSNGKSAADLVSHKKRLREWFQVQTHTHLTAECRLHIISGLQQQRNRDGDSQPSDHSDSESDHEISEEAVLGAAFSLSRPSEPLSSKQRRIAKVIQQIPSGLEAAAATEAAVAAEKKASQAELPTVAKKQAQQEAVWTALEDRLPAELPVKDAAALGPANDGPADADLQVLNEDDLVTKLVGLPWEFVINKAARQEWAGMDRQFRLLVAKRLQRIGEGFWGRDGGTERRLGHVRGLEVYRTLLTKGGRIVFEVAVDYSQTSHTWKEMIRLWVVTLDHDRYEHELNSIAESHSKSIKARDNVKLKAVGTGGGDLHARVPKIYQAIDQSGEDYEAALKALADANTEVREHFPAASASQDTYTLLKFYNLSTDLVKAVLRSYGEDTDIDFPFRVSPSEQKIIENDPDPPCSIVLVGRSGTGKTTCAVFRMWSRWLAFRHHSAEPFHQIFLTANPKLRSEVAKQFHKLRAAVLHDLEEAKRLEELSNQDYQSLHNIPSDAFPLFWTTKQYLRAVDATLVKPFFPRLEGGGLVHQEHAHNEDMGGIESLIDMDAGFSDDNDDEEEDAEEEYNEDEQPGAGPEQPTQKKGSLGPKLEADYDFFVNVMWAAITTKTERQTMTPAVVYQEICSFLKGSAEAMESGKLTLSQYLEVGRKRAPTFNADTRQLVYPIFERYEREKLRRNRYDHMDLLFHICSSLKATGYKGTIIHNIYRDEVQDFTQAELLVDLRTMADPNGLFCCGDPCQTIARGIVFRFADICTLFHQESEKRKAAGGQAAAMRVGQPKTPWHLPTNYRTHSGILGAAAAVVDVLREQFSQHVDKLPREKAFFQGPPPLLLSSVNPEDLTFLLLGSDPKTSQVEFGAHQVILGRSKESLDSLPQHLRDSNVIRMTVTQSKGLEFDDVFLWDFFSGSPADWRPLNNFTHMLEEVERSEGARKLPAGTPLVEVDVEPEDKGFLRLARNEDPDVLLCEEYKHLYTAITRAKNNVIVFDRDKAKRAPFFHYLRRLGLAQHTSKSVMEEHSDDSRYVLTQGKNSPEDWIQRGNNFMECRIFDLAAHCYKVAKDSVRCTVANAYASALDVKKNRKGRLTAEQRTQCFEVGHDLMVAAASADQAPVLVSVVQRKKWLAIAASMLSTNKDSSPLAARLYIMLGDLRSAVTAYLRCGDLVSAARTCETLAGSVPSEANHWLQEAIKHYRKAKQPVESFDLLLRHPQLQTTLSGQNMDDLAGIAMTAYNQKGEHDKAIGACRKIRSAASRHQKLASLGYWEELARDIQDNSKAADILASHGHVEAAVRRLMHPYQVAVVQGRQLDFTSADPAVLKQLHTYCARVAAESQRAYWAQEQMAIVVDAYDIEDPFFGHGFMAKGKLLQSRGHPGDALDHFKLALQAFRNRQHHAYDCLVATAAIMELVSEQDLDTAWSATSTKDAGKKGDTVTNEYIAGVLEAGQAAQDMLSALLCKPSDRQVPRYRASLMELESYFEVKGLPGHQKELVYNVHNAAFLLARAGINAADNQAVKQTATESTVLRRIAQEAMASSLASLASPALRRACRAINKRLLHSSQDQSKLHELTINVKQVVHGLDIFSVAGKLLDLEAGVSKSAAQLWRHVDQSHVVPQTEREAMQAAIGASIVQLQLPIACVDGITSQMIAPFKRVAQQARVRTNPLSGFSSLNRSWSQLLHSHTVLEKGQNQNAGFAAWVLASVLLLEGNSFRQEAEKLSRQLRKAKRLAVDCEMLSSASQAFAQRTPEHACQALLFYKERCRVLAMQPEQQPMHQLALEAHLYLVEAVGPLVLLGLGRFAFLPEHYTEMLEQSPLLGRKSSSRDGPRVNLLRSQWQKEVKLENTITMLTQIVRLLHDLVVNTIRDPAAVAARPQLTSAVNPSQGDTSEETVKSDQQRAACRVIVLTITLLTACDVHNTGPKVAKVPADLITAAWKVVDAATACVKNEDFLRYLDRYKAASNIGSALKEQLGLAYRLTTGLTLVKSSGYIAFDRMPTQAPGLKSKDPEVNLLLQLAKASRMPCPKDTVTKPSKAVRQLLLMPDISEVAAFKKGTGTGAKMAAAALVIQQAYRQHRHCTLCKAKLRYLRTSSLWRQAVRKWRHEIQATFASRRDAAAVAAMEAQRKQHEADAQRRLAWVDQALQQQHKLGNMTCPVCCKDAEKLFKAAQKKLAGGNESDEEEDDDEPVQAANNPFAALSGLAVNAPDFVPHRMKDYHLESLASFQAYKQFYTEQVVPVLSEQQSMEAALTEAEPRAATDAEFQNTLNEERFKLDGSLKQIQNCMEHFEKEHAWQDHLTQLPELLAAHSGYLQNVKVWLQQGQEPAVAEAVDTIHTPRPASAGVSWGIPSAEASWNSPEKEEAREYDMYDDADPFDDAEFEPVQSRKQRKAAKRGKGKGKW